MPGLGPLPSIGDTSLPEGYTRETWEASFKESLKGKPTPFPDLTCTDLGEDLSELRQQLQPSAGTASAEAAPPSEAAVAVAAAGSAVAAAAAQAGADAATLAGGSAEAAALAALSGPPLTRKKLEPIARPN
mmetsp:Transcript_28659/g.85249  ORF Transcript_28659/g.85249 Transcript_28659/m.85249 type:complete len:131 (-) Transcript_28659:61-453(-)